LLLKNTAKIVKNSKNMTFRKLDLFPSSGAGKPTLLGPLERASLSHRTTDVVDSVINSRDSGGPKKKEDPLCFVYIPYVKGISDG
jgi:hypothetical protein